MRILGIDPGTRLMGFGVIDASGAHPKFLAAGTLTAPATRPLPERLKVLYHELRAELIRSRPDAIAVERAFHGRNSASLIALGEARGVALLCAAEQEVPIHEYAPAAVKKAVTGLGAASKDQVAKMVRVMLGAEAIADQGPDATDALAIAICHHQRGSGAAGLLASISAGGRGSRTVRRGRGR